MKIRSLTLKNIGVFEDETISFPEKKDKDLAVSTGAEIHILTGQNGTGKTTILQALANFVSRSDKYSTFSQKKFQINLYKKFNSNSNSILKLDDSIEMVLKKENFYINNPLLYIHKLPISFSYSGYRFIEHKENIDIKEKGSYDPLTNALEFVKDYGENDYTLNQWLANNISKRSFARDEGNEEKAKIFDKNIKFLEQIIQEIIEKPIKFEPVYETGIKIVANIEGKKLDFDLLPDGLRSIISWLGDLIMRMDALKWKDDLPIFERDFILFLDEIEVHLHPSWQRKILPVVQKLFKNAQIFITTHSPFIVNSVDGAYIYELDLDENGHSKVTKIRKSNTADSYQTVIREVFETERFSEQFEDELKQFTDLRNDILLHKNIDEKAFLEKAAELANRNDEVKNTILFELRQLSNKTGKAFAL